MTKLVMIVRNNQGASERYPDLPSLSQAKRILDTWQDPENLSATIYDQEDGQEIAVKPFGAKKVNKNDED